MQQIFAFVFVFLSTPSARRATALLGLHVLVLGISIHALREEGDGSFRIVAATSRISIHALREEGDFSLAFILQIQLYFYPRPPRGGRPGEPVRYRPSVQISIHALREEGDAASAVTTRPTTIFLSTPSARRATSHIEELPDLCVISIHALREEGDCKLYKVFYDDCNFYPRPPRGGRPQGPLYVRQHWDFYPRPPRGGRPYSLPSNL